MEIYEFLKIQITFLFFLLVGTVAYGQQKLIFQVKDSNSKENIPNVHILNSDRELIDISDNFGKCKISYQDIIFDTVYVTCIGYKDKILSIKNILNHSAVELYLDTLLLNSVTVTPLSPKEIIKKCILSISRNYYKNDTIEGNHAIEVYVNSIFTNKSTYPIEIVQRGIHYIPTIFSSSKDSAFIQDVNLIQESFSFDHIFYKKGFMNLQNLDSWKFEILGYRLYHDQELIIVSAKYISDGTVSHKGKLFISPIDYGILQIEYNYKWHKLWLKKMGESLYTSQTKWSGYASFKKDHSGYSLANLNYIIEREVYQKVEHFHNELLKTYQFTSEFTSDRLNVTLK